MLNEMDVLDAFACRGGAGSGYLRAGARRVVAVDKVDYSKSYPNDGRWDFVQANAVDFIRDHGREFGLIHMSPPCQKRTRGNAPRREDERHLEKWPDWIAPAREAAIETGVPYVIENVEDAAPDLHDPVLLCGRMFDLRAVDTHPDAVGMELVLDRHRLFEFGGMPRPGQPTHPTHTRTSGIGLVQGSTNGWSIETLAASRRGRFLTGQPHVAGVYGGARRDPWEAKYIRKGGYVPKDIAVLQELLGTPWIDTERELFEAIPPAYTNWVAAQVERVLHGSTP